MVFPRQVVVAHSIGQEINCRYETQIFISVITKAHTVLDSAIIYFHKLSIAPVQFVYDITEWKRLLIVNLIGSKLIKEFTAFSGMRIFLTI